MKRTLQLIVATLAMVAATAYADGVKAAYHFNMGLAQADAGLRNINNHLNADAGAKIVVVAHGKGIDFLLPGAKTPKGGEFTGAISALAAKGVEFRVTVAPNLLAELENDQREVRAQLSAKDIQVQGELSPISPADFEAQLKQDPMASELLQGGIDGFIKAREQLAALLRETFLSTTEI